MPTDNPLSQKAINTIRFLAVDGVQKAKAGHPGAPMGLAPAAYVLWTRFLKHNPADPRWPNRDRFILSAGHASMLLYSLLYLTGYDLPLEELKQFRQWDSMTPGHPEYGLTPGVETTTGPLGQGFANGVGMAMAEAHMAATFNRPGHDVVDHYVYAIVSDGDLMEGVASEAASLAGHLKLGRLIYLYDDNKISIDGSTDLTFTEDRMARFRAYGWHTQTIEDGNDLEAIEAAIKIAQAESERPSIIAVRTIIGYGSPNKADKSSAHGEPLGEEEVLLTKQNLGWPPEPTFLVPDDVLAHFRHAVSAGVQAQAQWQKAFDAYAADYPNLAAEWSRRQQGALPDSWDGGPKPFEIGGSSSTRALEIGGRVAPPGGVVRSFEPGKSAATRNAGGEVLNDLAAHLPELFGGDADLAPSTKTLIKSSGDFQAGDYGNRNIRFGVREHAMGAIVNGIAVYGGLRPFGATFMVFADYMRPPLRLAAMMHAPSLFVFTHDSIGVGEDGPTHQPVEQLASLRAIPGLTVIRPADAKETAAAWLVAVAHRHGPVAFALTRQALPILAETSDDPASGVALGAYVVADWNDSDGKRVILIASGSELALALEARQRLSEQGVSARVVSMPSWELFDAQPSDYRDSVLPPTVIARVAIEAGVTMGWQRYVGLDGAVIGLDRFGASSPYKTAMQELGFNVENVVQTALGVLG